MNVSLDDLRFRIQLRVEDAIEGLYESLDDLASDSGATSIDMIVSLRDAWDTAVDDVVDGYDEWIRESWETA